VVEIRKSAAETLPFLSIPWRRFPAWAKIATVVLFAGALVAAAGIGAWRYPNLSPLEGEAAEDRITAIFGEPDNADHVLIGDYMIERFQAIDVDTGERYIADLCKGRVKALVKTDRKDGAGFYMITLDRTGLQAESDRLMNLVLRSVPARGGRWESYLGLRVQGGPTSDAFPLNYSGLIPKKRIGFHWPGSPDINTFLAKQSYAEASGGARALNIGENMYLLSSNENFPFLFRNEFHINRAVFISYIFFVDATSPEQVKAYQEISRVVPLLP
jgi:hypothetical protein